MEHFFSKNPKKMQIEATEVLIEISGSSVANGFWFLR